MADQSDDAELIASFVSELRDVAAPTSESAPVGEAVVGGAALIAEAEVARPTGAHGAIPGSPFDASVEAEALTPSFEGVEVSEDADADRIVADVLYIAPAEQGTGSWPEGEWEAPSLDEIREDLTEAIAPSQESVQATEHGVVESNDAGQLEAAERAGAVDGRSSGHPGEAIPRDGASHEQWGEPSLLSLVAAGDDQPDGEGAEGGEEMEATPFDHLTGDRLAVLVERGPESIEALVVATEAQARAVDVLEGLARRLRSGDLAVAPGSGTSAESVLASILAALLSERP